MVSFKLTKKPNHVDHSITLDEPIYTAIKSVSASGAIQPQIEIIEINSKEELVIPCPTRYVSEPPADTHESHTSMKTVGLKEFESVGELKKPKTSILMKIREARESGKLQDAPDIRKRSYDPEDFAWGMLRGMGFDEETIKDEAMQESTRSTSHDKMGIGAANQLKRMKSE